MDERKGCSSAISSVMRRVISKAAIREVPTHPYRVPCEGIPDLFGRKEQAARTSPRFERASSNIQLTQDLGPRPVGRGSRGLPAGRPRRTPTALACHLLDAFAQSGLAGSGLSQDEQQLAPPVFRNVQDFARLAQVAPTPYERAHRPDPDVLAPSP